MLPAQHLRFARSFIGRPGVRHNKFNVHVAGGQEETRSETVDEVSVFVPYN